MSEQFDRADYYTEADRKAIAEKFIKEMLGSTKGLDAWLSMSVCRQRADNNEYVLLGALSENKKGYSQPICMRPIGKRFFAIHVVKISIHREKETMYFDPGSSFLVVYPLEMKTLLRRGWVTLRDGEKVYLFPNGKEKQWTAGCN